MEHQAVGKSTSEEKRFHFDGKRKARLKGIDPSQKAGFEDRKEAERRTAEDVAAIDKLQDRLYAEGKQALLAIIDPGELFGELALFEKGQREEFAETMEKSTYQ